MATHVPEDEPTCPECGKTFSCKASLKAHIMLHENDETLKCKECGDEFGLQTQLDEHRQEHLQEQSGRKTYQSKQGNFKFKKPSFRGNKQHNKIKASADHQQYHKNNDRSDFHYKCQHCGQNFQKAGQLVLHKKIHTENSQSASKETGNYLDGIDCERGYKESTTKPQETTELYNRFGNGSNSSTDVMKISPSPPEVQLHNTRQVAGCRVDHNENSTQWFSSM